MALHPVVQKMLQAMRAAGRPALSAGSPAQAREVVSASRSALGAGPQVGPVSELRVPTRAGQLAARLYRAQSGQEPGLVVYLHGGGWVCGSVDDFDVLARALVDTSGCAVLSVDYRLAPEFPFPAGLEDAQDAMVWAHDHMVQLLGHGARLVVAGDSAGANLATVAATLLRQKISIALQCLFYPVTDADFSRASYQAHGEGLPLTQADMQWFFGLYAPPALWQEAQISPVRHPDLAGSPPAWIAAAEYDVLHDEALDYAARLRAAGVPVTLQRVLGLPHGFARMLNLIPEAGAAVSDAAEHIRLACGPMKTSAL
jgi:acetyl esterase